MSARLLIIEDDSMLNQMLSLHFEDEGYEVVSAVTCSEGLEQLTTSAFDLVLLDQLLPLLQLHQLLLKNLLQMFLQLQLLILKLLVMLTFLNLQ